MRENDVDKNLLNLAGEYRVCSELCKRGIFATLTYGNRKSADVYVIADPTKRALRIEVKTSQKAKFVTSLTQKYTLRETSDPPDFWVLVSLKKLGEAQFEEGFFVLNHAELKAIQNDTNERSSVGYRQKHGKNPDYSKGVDNVRLKEVETHRDRWDKIWNALKHKDVDTGK